MFQKSESTSITERGSDQIPFGDVRTEIGVASTPLQLDTGRIKRIAYVTVINLRRLGARPSAMIVDLISQTDEATGSRGRMRATQRRAHFGGRYRPGAEQVSRKRFCCSEPTRTGRVFAIRRNATRFREKFEKFLNRRFPNARRRNRRLVETEKLFSTKEEQLFGYQLR